MAQTDMFQILDWDLQPSENKVSFHYDCAKYGSFLEHVIFPKNVSLEERKDCQALHMLLDFCAALLGVSYYKAAALQDISFNAEYSDAAKKAIQALYTEGLGEFYIRNHLTYPPAINFHFQKNRKILEAPRTAANKRAILAFGGGKDSHVANAILEKAGIEKELVSIVLAENTRQKLETLAPQKLTFIDRKIDPKLLELAKEKEGYNGHVPITAINSILLCLYAYLQGSKYVIFSNERGASVPTMMYEGHAVNHQYSKSHAFEGLFRNMIDETFGDELQYFSILRPFSELWIAQYLAANAKDALPVFSSCNKNFIFHKSDDNNELDKSQKWCGRCSKCVYTAMILAPYLGHVQFKTIFGSDILDRPENLQTAKNLTGIGDLKPWECVGDFIDTASSLIRLGEQDGWKDALIVQELVTDLIQKYGLEVLEKRFEEERLKTGPHFIPEEFQGVLDLASGA